MQDNQTNKSNKETPPVIAAVTGAVIGAGVTVGALALKDKTNRKKVKEALINAKKQVSK